WLPRSAPALVQPNTIRSGRAVARSRAAGSACSSSMRLSPSGVVSSRYMRAVCTVAPGRRAAQRSGSITVFEDGTSSPTRRPRSMVPLGCLSPPPPGPGVPPPQDLQVGRCRRLQLVHLRMDEQLEAGVSADVLHGDAGLQAAQAHPPAPRLEVEQGQVGDDGARPLGDQAGLVAGVPAAEVARAGHEVDPLDEAAGVVGGAPQHLVAERGDVVGAARAGQADARPPDRADEAGVDVAVRVDLSGAEEAVVEEAGLRQQEDVGGGGWRRLASTEASSGTPTPANTARWSRSRRLAETVISSCGVQLTAPSAPR